MKRVTLLALALCFAGHSSFASTASATFQVSATVSNACSVSAQNVSFGTYNPLLGSSLFVNGGVNVTCTLGTAYQIGLNAGAASGATVTTRQMTSGANALSYALYRDLLHTLNWGNTPNTDTLGGTGTGLSINYPVYANLPAAQSVATGSYADTITVTVTY